MTFLELKTEVFNILGDDIDTPQHFTEAEIGRYVNDTYRRIVGETGCLEVEHVISLTANVGVYDLPNWVSRIYRASYAEQRIAATSTHNLDRYERGWQESTGELQAFYLDNLEHDQIGFWRLPATGSGVELDSDFGVVIDIDGTVHFRFESRTASLGTVTDFTHTGDTVVFAAAGSGGGADPDYGIVVDISSDDSSVYTWDSELGSIVDIDVGDENDDEVFVGYDGGSTTDEYGLVTDIDDASGTDQYTFLNDDGQQADTYVMSAEVGGITDVDGSNILGQFGIATLWDGTAEVSANQDYGVVVAAGDMELGVVTDLDNPQESVRVWAKRDANDLMDDDEAPMIPLHSHQGIAYGAAARALFKNSEDRNAELGSLLMAMEKEYTSFLRKLVVRRSGETLRRMRPTRASGRNHRQYPRLPSAYPRIH